MLGARGECGKVGRQAQDHHLANAHHHEPGDDLDAGGRKFVVPSGLAQMLVDLVHRLALVVAEEDREQHLARLIEVGWQRRRLLRVRGAGECDGERQRGQQLADVATIRRHGCSPAWMRQ
jgi:hypothetical protein